MRLTVNEILELCQRFGIDAKHQKGDSTKTADIHHCRAILVRILEQTKPKKMTWRDKLIERGFDPASIFCVAMVDIPGECFIVFFDGKPSKFAKAKLLEEKHATIAVHIEIPSRITTLVDQVMKARLRSSD